MISRRISIFGVLSGVYLAAMACLSGLADYVVRQVEAVLEPVTIQKAEIEMAYQASEKVTDNREKAPSVFGAGDSAARFVSMLTAINSRSYGNACT